MTFKEIPFKDTNAQRVYSNYIQSIKNELKPILEKDRLDVLMEFNSHIYEHIQGNPLKSELDALLDAIDKLGAPEEVLKPLVADKLLEKASRTFNPLDILKALLLNISNGVSYVIFLVLYLSLSTFIFLIFAKLFSNNVGLFYKDDEFQALGFVSGADRYEEVLGNWFIPVMILAFIIFYTILTLLLKLKKSLSKK